MKSTQKLDHQFLEVIGMIREARFNAIKSVNAELIRLYWNVGEYISKKLEAAEWGDQVVDGLAEYIERKHPEIRGFNRRGLYRMRQFYEVYRHRAIVSTLLTQISWSCHVLIISKTKSIEEKEFYIQLTIKEGYSVRELERQIGSGYYERTILSKKIVLPVVTQRLPKAAEMFKDIYVLDFLNLPEKALEKKLHELFEQI